MLSLNDIAARHSEWVSMARYLGGSEVHVQDMYIKLHKYTGKQFNSAYIFFTLRSLIFGKKKAITTTPFNGYEFPSDDTSTDRHMFDDHFNTRIDEILDTLHWYDKKLFNIYRYSGKSYRKLAAEIGISYVSIYNTIRNVKTIIHEELKEEYQIYKEEIGEEVGI